MALIDWTAELARGVLSQAVLAALAHKERHGYELVSVMRRHGFPRVQGGTLYPLLRRLEQQQLVTYAWDTSIAGPARKVFSLTEVGRAELHHARSAWDQMGQALLSLENADRKVPK
ncbi:PadR family transcriptional regulator [Kineococcus auxinigenes]|uniref:PadR family transcriptional regulator n=1 Tax=unclassified Kineococcus TaxID=2621656 RepID=UPI003D7E1DC1